MSDELIIIPSFLKGSPSVSATAACAFCTEIACEDEDMGDCTKVVCQKASEGTCQSTQGGTGGCGECDTSEGSPPSKQDPGEIKSFSSTATTITIHFSIISNASSYEVAYREASEVIATYVDTESSSTTYTITGLNPDTEYVVNYRGLSKYGDGPFMESGTHIWTSKSGCNIYVDGAWRDAVPYIHDGSGWKQASEKLWTS